LKQLETVQQKHKTLQLTQHHSFFYFYYDTSNYITSSLTKA